MEIKELEGKTASELLRLSDEIRQLAVKKMVQEQLQAQIPEIERQIEKAHADYCLSQLAGEKAKNEEMRSRETSWKKEREALQQQLGTYQEQQRRLEEESARQEERLRELQVSVEAHNREREGYLLACREGVSEFLPFIRTETYEAYVNSLYSRDNITLIYNRMRDDCVRGDKERLELYQRLVKEHIEISRRITGKEVVQLQKVSINMLFNPACFDKTPASPETGRISDIVYYGLERNGVVVSTCRSLVEVV